MSDVEIARITRAVDQNGKEWVPADEYDRELMGWEALRCMVVNPRRNVMRALNALNEGDLSRVHDRLVDAAEQLDAAYAEAFPPVPIP